MKTINFNENNTLIRSNITELYRIDMQKYKPLSTDETKYYVMLAQKGNDKALTKVVNANLRIVWSIAKKYSNLGLPFEDVLQDGNIGLIAAIKTYDVSRETKLSTWILERVREHINIGLTNNSRTVRMHLGQIKRKENYSHTSMDAPIENDSDNGSKTYGDCFSGDMNADRETEIMDAKIKIKYLLNGLTERERAIVCGLFGIGTQECSEYTLAKRFNLTEERVRQLKWAALEKMQKMVKS